MTRPSRRRLLGYLMALFVPVFPKGAGASAAEGLSVHEGWVLRGDDLDRLARR